VWRVLGVVAGVQDPTVLVYELGPWFSRVAVLESGDVCWLPNVFDGERLFRPVDAR